MKNKASKTIEETYKKLTLREQILLRPDTYIGSVEPTETYMWVAAWDDTQAKPVIEKKPVKYVPGYIKIFDEVITNASDHKHRGGRVKNIRVYCGKTDESGNYKIKITNDGTGIPVTVHAVEKCYVPELIFGHLLTGSNYDDTEDRFGGGRNGFGTKLTNIFSKHFTVRTDDGKSVFNGSWKDNMSSLPHTDIQESKKGSQTGTEIEFTPDFDKLSMTADMLSDAESIMLKRTLDIAAYNPDVNVYFNDKLLPVDSFEDYAKMHLSVDASIFSDKINDRFEIVIAQSPSDNFEQVSIVNGISTHTGGTHVNYFTNQIVSKLSDEILKDNKKIKLKPSDVKSKLYVFVSAKVANPTFDTQTKENLTSKMTQEVTLGGEVSNNTIKKIAKSDIVASILEWIALKEQAALAKMSKSGGKRVKIAKLQDAYKAGTAESEKCALILTEGDSAAATAVAGLSVVGREHYGVFPLKGKPLNVRRATTSKVRDNKEISAILNAVGLVPGKKYNSKSDLRYGKLIIFTDADTDGIHIKGLLINVIHHYWPELLEMDFLFEFITPIVRSRKGSKVVDFYAIDEYKRAKESGELDGYHNKYYKGLGTILSDEIKVMFKDLNKHLIKFEWDGEDANNRIELLFADKREDDRKNWLLNFSGDTVPEKFGKPNPITRFFDVEFVQFSMSDNVRSIPKMMDGLKPSQRKILYTCLKRNIQHEMKVAQLAGSVAEITHYAQGEDSLNEAIIGLAQNFVGANNIPLLAPKGQFGTRLEGGVDYASPRYIFTHLDPVTRLIFRPEDDAILESQYEDGDVIEPVEYLPIVPMVLINGTKGIGTGWSTDIRKYSTKGIIAVLQHKLTGGKKRYKLKPEFSDFRGTTEIDDTGRIITHGTYSIKKDEVHITELPVETWTNKYTSMLDDLVESKIIRDYKNASTDKTVDIKVYFPRGSKITDREIALLKLTSSMTTTNMHAFVGNSIVKYDTPEELLDSWYVKRLEFYDVRKKSMLNNIKHQYYKYANVYKFINYVVNEKLKINNVAKNAIEAEMEKLEFHKIDGNYDYLLSMPIYSLTKERMEKSKNDRDAKKQQYKDLESKSPEELWLSDLNDLKNYLSKK